MFQQRPLCPEKMKLMELQLKPSEEPPDISPDDPATGAIAQT